MNEALSSKRGFHLPAGLYIRVGSHRAGDRVRRAVGRKLREFWSFDGPHIQLIRPDEWEKVKTIPGVTRARIKKPESYGECWYLDEKDERYTRGCP
jgi:hypothetical protein